MACSMPETVPMSVRRAQNYGRSPRPTLLGRQLS